MNKKVFGRKLGRSRPAREALFSQLIRGMILNGKIVTTHAKAKAIQGDLERMVSLAKKADVNARRKVLAYLDNAKDTITVLFKDVAPFFASKQSGFTRIIRLPTRKGDNSKMVRIEWTEKVEAPKAVKKSKDKKVETIKPAKAVKAKVVKKADKASKK